MNTPSPAPARLCEAKEFDRILEIINDGAEIYRGLIPAENWHEPYMGHGYLAKEIAAGVAFWGRDTDAGLCAVMGIQDVVDVTLIRHAYVLTSHQRQGHGTALLAHLMEIAALPLLVGTWAKAGHAIAFYQKHGFVLIDRTRIADVLDTYWDIPPAQVANSVVLAGPGFGI